MGKIFYSYFKEDDIENIVNGLSNKKEYSILIPYQNAVSELLISRVTSKLLSNISQDKQSSRLSFIVNKMVEIVSKSNIKRTYFKENNLDINSNSDYKKGLELLEADEYYDKYIVTDQYKEDRYSLRVTISVLKDSFNFSIINQCAPLPLTIEMIKQSAKLSDDYSSISELFREEPDILEKIEFSYLLIGMMFKKMGIPSDSILTKSDGQTTNISLNIEFANILDFSQCKMSDKLVKEIEALPQFPSSIKKLQVELTDPDWDYNRISDSILSDPSLTAEVLRLVNSPTYKLNNKIDKISIAVKEIGVDGLNGILYYHGIIKSLKSKYDLDIIDSINKHLFQVAIISSYLASTKHLQDFSEDIYVAALMHDLGKIVLNSSPSDIFHKLSKVCHENMIQLDILDYLLDGCTHSIIGSKLLEKWDFPDKYINVMLYHHFPLEAPDEHKIIIYSVYLGNKITEYLDGNDKYSSFSSTVLEYFNLDTPEKFKVFIKKLKKEGLYI